MSKEFLPIVKPKDIALKNTGKLLILRIMGKEYEMRKETIDQLTEMANFVLRSKHPTEWITGYEDMVREEQVELWGPVTADVDDDPIVGAT